MNIIMVVLLRIHSQVCGSRHCVLFGLCKGFRIRCGVQILPSRARENVVNGYAVGGYAVGGYAVGG